MTGFERSNFKKSKTSKEKFSFLDGDDEHDEYLEAKRRKRAGLPAAEEEKQQSKPFKRSKTYKADVVTDVKIVVKEDCSLLSYETVTTDMVVLGCISEVTHAAATVCLPGSMFAIAPKSLISSYSDLSLQNILNEQQIVVCKIVSKRASLDNTWRVIVSLDPARVNSHIPHYAVDIGMSVMGVVQSAEDHGYVIDCGIANLRAFLPSKAARNWCKTFNKGKPLVEGQLIRCYVSKRSSNNNASNVELTTDIDPSKLALNSNVNVSNVLPGSFVNGSIKKALSDGVKVSVQGLRCPAYINDLHKMSKNKKNKKLNESFSAVILYADVSSNKVMLGSHPCFQQLQLPRAEFPEKAVIDCAKVDSVRKDGVTVKFLKEGRSFKGFIPISNAEKLVTSNNSGTVKENVGNNATDSDYASDNSTEDTTPLPEKTSQSNVFNRLHKKLKQLKIIPCRILQFSFMDQIYQCSLKSEFEEADLNLNEFRLKSQPDWLVVGKCFKATVTKVTSQFLCVNVKNQKINGLIPVHELSDNIESTSFLLQSYCEDDIIENAHFCYLDDNIPVFSVKPSIIRFFKENGTKLPNGWSSLAEGMLVPCSVSEVINRRISGIIVSTHVPSFPEVMVTDENLLLPNLPATRPVCKQTVLSLVTKHDETELALDCRLHKVWDFSLSTSIELFQNYLNEMIRVQRLSTGAQVQCVANSKNSDGSWKVNFLVYTGIHGLLPPEFCEAKNLKIGSAISATVLWDNPSENTVYVTNENEIKLESEELTNSIKKGVTIQCKLLYKHSDFSIAVIKSDQICSLNEQLVYIITKLHQNDFQRLLSQISVKVGDILDVQVLSIENSVVIGILTDALELIKNEASSCHNLENSKRKYLSDDNKTEKVPRKKSKSQKSEEASGKKNKLLMMLDDLVQDDSEDEGKNGSTACTIKKKEKKDKKELNKKNKILNGSGMIQKSLKSASDASGDDIEMSEVCYIETSKPRKSIESKLSDTGFDWHASLTSLQKVISEKDNVDSEEEDTESSPRKKKKLTAAERRELSKQKEAKIRQAEEELLNAEKNPQSADHFDRLLLASPNDSALWIKYMAYHLQGTEIEKAKSVAKRALQTINHREEDERLNVWSALLNLEHLYGTPDSFQKCLTEALQTNDEWKIYSRVMQIYVSSKKTKELEKLVDLATKKLRNSFDVFVQCGEYLLQAGATEKSRSIMQRALSALPKNKHVDLTVRFAHFENRYGCQERAQTLFEHILTSFPKRIDVWISYVDLLVKANRIDLARQVIERGVAQKLKPHKMKSLFNKWLSFENEHGTPDLVAHVKEEIKQYAGIKDE